MEVGEARDQPLGGKGGHHGDGQPAMGRVDGLQLAPCKRDLVEGGRDRGQELHGGLGKDHGAALALEQWHAGPLLQRGDLVADGALRHGQFVGGAGEAEVTGRGFEGAEGIQGGKLAFHHAII